MVGLQKVQVIVPLIYQVLHGGTLSRTIIIKSFAQKKVVKLQIGVSLMLSRNAQIAGAG
jgi:hypothetical protein